MLSSRQGRPRPYRSAGSVALRRLLEEGTNTALAAVCEVSQSTVSRWASGAMAPRRRRRLLLETLFRIPLGAWDEPAVSSPARAA